MKSVFGIALAGILVATVSASAGELGGHKDTYSVSQHCRFVEDADELISYPTTRALRAEVKSRYEHAAEVAESNRAVYSLSPLYEWASQAAIHCAKSYGYLRKRRKWHRRPDYVTLQKCECFYERMIAYGGGQ